MARYAMCVVVVLVVICATTCHGHKLSMPKILHLDQCEVVVRSDCLDKPLPQGKRICVQLTDEALFEKLKDIGGYNPKYVAMNRTAAAKFKDPRLFYSEKKKHKKLPTRSPGCHKTHPPTTRTPPTRPVTTRRPTYWRRRRRYKRPRRYRKPRHRPKRRPNVRKPQDESMNDPIVIQEISSNREKDLRRSDDLEIIQSCWRRGSKVKVSPVYSERYHICGECHVVSYLTNMTPRFINEAVCQHQVDQEKSSDQVQDGNQCAWKLGLCQQRVLTFPAIRLTGKYELNTKVLINGKHVYFEKTTEVEQKIRSSCQCEVIQVAKNALDKLVKQQSG